jgi:hypothetical protein
MKSHHNRLIPHKKFSLQRTVHSAMLQPGAIMASLTTHAICIFFITWTRLTSLGLTPDLSSAAIPFSEMKTNLSTSTALHTFFRPSYRAFYPVLARRNILLSLRARNKLLVYELRTNLSDLGYPQPPSIIMCDNTCAIGIATYSIKQKRSKAIDMRFHFHWVRDRVRQGQFIISYIKSADNIYCRLHYKKLGSTQT